jgi:hypothetical protein
MVVFLIRIGLTLTSSPQTSHLQSGPVTAGLYAWSVVFAICSISGMIMMIGEKLQADVQILRGIIPICSSCKKIRDDEGYWNRLESYFSRHSQTRFTHGLCPDCLRDLYPDVADKVMAEMEEQEQSQTAAAQQKEGRSLLGKLRPVSLSAKPSPGRRRR